MIKLIYESNYMDEMGNPVQEEKILSVARRSLDLSDFADELWRLYISEESAIEIINALYNSGRLTGRLVKDIEYHINNGDLEDVVDDVYYYQNDSWNSIKSHFGRI